jgi:hypothetical protein
MEFTYLHIDNERYSKYFLFLFIRYFPVLSGLFNKQQNHGMVSNNLYQNVTGKICL